MSNLQIAEVSQGMNLEISQTSQGIKLELAFGFTQTKADARYATIIQLNTLTARVTAAESSITTLDGQAAKQAIKTIHIGQVDVTATTKNDTVTIDTAGGITVSGNAAQKKITIDTSWLKSKILGVEAAAATSAFKAITSRDDSSTLSAANNADTLYIKTLQQGGGQPLLSAKLDDQTQTLIIDIRKIEGVVNSLNSAINNEISNRGTAINQAISTEINNRNQAIATTCNLKQNITDSGFETTAKTVPGAVNELKGRIDSHDTALTQATEAEITTIVNS